jgi:hypothetical protein
VNEVADTTDVRIRRQEKSLFDPRRGGVPVSTSGDPIKRLTRHHIRFIRLKKFSDRLSRALVDGGVHHVPAPT